MKKSCDVCGDLVDLESDPTFRIHNYENYERHVRLSHPDQDAARIIREHKETYCGICGERLTGDKAEMYDPRWPEKDAVICHAECGLGKGYEVA